MIITIVALGLQAAPTPTAKVAGKWGVDYGKDRCVINRTVPLRKDTALLAIETGPQTGTGNILLLAPELSTSRTAGTAKFAPLPASKPTAARWVSVHGPTGLSGIRIVIEHERWADVMLAQTLSIDGFGHDPLVVPLQGIDKAVRAAQVCGRTLLREWGADPDAMIALEPTGQMISWITYDDYPTEAVRAGQQGTVGILTTINAKGKPTACRAVISSGVTSLDAASCRAIMMRASFPASDKPARYYYRQVVWAIAGG